MFQISVGIWETLKDWENLRKTERLWKNLKQPKSFGNLDKLWKNSLRQRLAASLHTCLHLAWGGVQSNSQEKEKCDEMDKVKRYLFKMLVPWIRTVIQYFLFWAWCFVMGGKMFVDNNFPVWTIYILAAAYIVVNHYGQAVRGLLFHFVLSVFIWLIYWRFDWTNAWCAWMASLENFLRGITRLIFGSDYYLHKILIWIDFLTGFVFECWQHCSLDWVLPIKTCDKILSIAPRCDNMTISI